MTPIAASSRCIGDVVLDVPKKKFEHIFDGVKKKMKVKFDYELKPEALKEIIAEYKKLVKKETGKDFPQDPKEQLVGARNAVFRSWMNERAKTYRRINRIDDWLGTAVNVQAMVFGNLGETSGTGVGFTRNPATGEKMFFGEYLMNAQGEDVVSGVRTPLPISELERVMPLCYEQLRTITGKMEKHYRDMQDFEFTIQDGKLYMLQTRNGKRTGLAAVRVAIDMVKEKLITQEEAIHRVEPNQLYDFLVPRLVEKGEKIEVLATGLPASPGAAVGQIVFSAEEAVKQHASGKFPVIILVRGETTPEDIAGMEVAAGILTSRGGMTSHAAVVTRGMGKCCVAGAGDCIVDEAKKELRVKGHTFKQGDWISLDGTTGRVINGKLKTLDAQPDDPDLVTFMAWVDPVRRLKVRANADIPRDAKMARQFGAEGIGLCRTEHMFFAEDRIEHMRTMILADNEKERRAALKKLLPMQRADFAGLFKAMESLPVTIRLLDPPLHEFLPKREDLLVEIARLEETKPRSPKLKELRPLLARVEELHETNPMLGLRGCRLGIAFPEITEMQVRAIIEAAVAAKVKGGNPHVEIMIPLVGSIEEMRNQAAIVRRVAEEVFKEKGIEGRLHGRHHDRTAPRSPHRRPDRRRGRVLQLRNQRPHANHLRHQPRRHQPLPAGLHEGGHLQAGPLRHPRSGWRRATGADGRCQGPSNPPNHQARHLRRTRRRSGVRQVLPQDRPDLRLLLALPSADGKARSSAGSPRREDERPSPHQRLVQQDSLNNQGRSQPAAPFLYPLLSACEHRRFGDKQEAQVP